MRLCRWCWDDPLSGVVERDRWSRGWFADDLGPLRDIFSLRARSLCTSISAWARRCCISWFDFSRCMMWLVAARRELKWRGLEPIPSTNLVPKGKPCYSSGWRRARHLSTWHIRREVRLDDAVPPRYVAFGWLPSWCWQDVQRGRHPSLDLLRQR